MKKSDYEIKSYYKDIYSVNYQRLKTIGIKLIIIDLDNTLGLVKDKIMPKKSKDLISKLKKDFTIVVASNNFKKRVNLFVDNMCDYVYLSLKPTKRLSRIIKRRYNIDNKNICIIGDQLVTDIKLGNKAGYYTILTDPLGEDGKVSFLNRKKEKKVKQEINFKDGEYFEEN